MGLLKNLLHKSTEDKVEFKKRFKDAEMEMKINKKLEERQKSSNERELEAYLKKQREEKIKNQLDKIHKQQNKEHWKGTHNVLTKGKSILKDDRPILKEKNIFLDNKSKNPLNQKRMFFK